MHPGGELLLLEYAGQDCTETFYAFHRQEILKKYLRLQIGTIVNEKPKIEWQEPGAFSKVPYAETSALQGFYSPYFTESHHKFRRAVREFIQNEIVPEAMVNDQSNQKASDEIFKKMGEFGLLACRMGV